MTNRWFVSLPALALAVGCASSPRPSPSVAETRQVSRYAVLHEGVELLAAVTYAEAERSLGDERMILAVELSSARGQGPITLKREDITLRTPRGDSLALIGQQDYRALFPRIRIAVERALFELPLLYRYQPNVRPCNQWFLVDPSAGVGSPGATAFDEISINSFEACSGPLVFTVPGGVQPGPWRLVVDLKESRASIPFRIEAR